MLRFFTSLLAAVAPSASPTPRTRPMPSHAGSPTQPYTKPPQAQLQDQLSPQSYACTQKNGTEAPFKNAYWDLDLDGIYLDVVSGEPLFSSLDKFKSSSGWPSFTKPLVALKTVRDSTLGMTRDEVRSPGADSHLGHVFDDGPGPGGQRFCINSASLRFVPIEPLDAFKKAGLGPYLFDFASRPEVAARHGWEVATFAGGCFWGVEELFEHEPGVIETQVGYAGGDPRRATYREVTSGTTGHAEAIQVLFDSKKTSYTQLLLRLFNIHDPTQKNRQANDRGTQYRSAIFVASPAQRQAAQSVMQRVERSKKWKAPLVTEVVDLAGFVRAEEGHQKYLDRNPQGYRCHVDHKLTF